MAVEEDDEWMEMGCRDDRLVAELLLRLRHAIPPPKPSPALRLVWTVRQRRSGGSGAGRKLNDDEKKRETITTKKGVESTRASPSTPLSWSAATSTSCGGAAEGPEESSRPAAGPPGSARSKVSSVKVIPAPMTAPGKRPKRKKTLAELKDEESQLLKERRSLKSELASLRLKVKKEQSKNESFKRKKLDLQEQQASNASSVQQLVIAAVQCLPAIPDVEDSDTEHRPSTKDVSEEARAIFELPDLNLPLDQQYTAEAICGTS